MDGGTPLTRKQRLQHLKTGLWQERSSWISHWREISEYQQPRAGRFVTTDRNKGDKKHNHVIDSTALFASRTLAAGLMSGVTSPARPWFRLELHDADLMEHGPVKTWLHDVAKLLRAIFAQSNTYRVLHSLYEELGLFGTAADVVLSDYDAVIHHYPMTIGEYALGIDERGIVNTLVREYEMTVDQIVRQFGLNACSITVRNLYTQCNYNATAKVIHVVQPRRDRDTKMADAKNMAYESVYFEEGTHNDQLLRDSGYRRFPVLAPRWVVTGNDVYGSSPGMAALGDVKQLQHGQLRKAQAIDYQVQPPLQVPASYKEAQKARLPGGVFYLSSAGNTPPVKSAFDVQLNLQHLLGDIMDVRERIRTAYYADLFLMLANDTRSGTTATEIAQRHEEKLLMLGPVLERLHNELLSPLIDIAFDEAMQADILPPVPREIQGMDLNVEFISVLAQAQRAVATQGMDRMLGAVGQLAPLRPEILDKVNFDQVVDDYAEAYGVNPKLVIPDDQVAAMREQRAQQQQAMQAAAAAPVAADTAKTASEIDTANLNDLMNQFSGYTVPSPEYVQ